MTLEEFAELDAIVEDIDEAENARAKFVGECIAAALGAKRVS